jgi:hypothetical protein
VAESFELPVYFGAQLPQNGVFEVVGGAEVKTVDKQREGV